MGAICEFEKQELGNHSTSLASELQRSLTCSSLTVCVPLLS